MKYDKYGDPIEEKVEKMTSKRRTAFIVTMILQVIIILINLVILVVPSINGYLCFILAPFYIFLYVTYIKAVQTVKDDGLPTGRHTAFKIISIIFYIATAALCMVINY